MKKILLVGSMFILFGFGGTVSASERDEVHFEESDIQNVITEEGDTVVVFPDNLVLVLEDYEGSIEGLEINVDLKDNTSLSRTIYKYGFPGSISASTSINKKNGPKSVWLERTKSKFSELAWRTAHYHGYLPKTSTKSVNGQWYSVYTGTLRFHYAS